MKNNTAQATKVITAHVPLPMADKVDQMAARLERSRGWVIKQALSAWLAQEEERNRLTLEALDADGSLLGVETTFHTEWDGGGLALADFASPIK